MDLTRTGVRALAGACALTLLLAACGGDDDSAETVDEPTEQTSAADETTTTEAAEDDTTTTAADETTTTAEEPDDSGDGSGDGTEGDADAVALAQRINLTIDDFAEGWTETPPEEDDGGANLDDCFVETDIEAATVGEAETGTFAVESEDGETGQLVTMQTVILDSADTAGALLAEAGGDAFITCAQGIFVEGFGEGTSVALSVLPDDPPYTEESFGLAGDIVLPTASGGMVNGVMDLHLFRTGEVVSFTATLDLGDLGIEATLGELYPVVADRHATEVG
jgi:hypothetical protein